MREPRSNPQGLSQKRQVYGDELMFLIKHNAGIFTRSDVNIEIPWKPRVKR